MIFRLIQHNFHVGSVYSLFHPAFHYYFHSSFIHHSLNLRTSNFEWFNKTKTLCKIITIKKITNIKLNWAWTAAKKILTIYLNYKKKMGKNSKMQQRDRSSTMTCFITFWKNPTDVSTLFTLAFYLGVAFHLIRVYKLW